MSQPDALERAAGRLRHPGDWLHRPHPRWRWHPREWPRDARQWLRHPPWWQAPTLSGVVAGIVLTVLALVLLAPGPYVAPVAPPPAGVPGATLTLDDAFLTRTVAAGLSTSQLPFTITHLRVHILPQAQITLAGDASFGPLTRPLTATCALDLRDGNLHATVTQVTVGGLTLPAPLDTALEAALNSQLASVQDGLQTSGARVRIVQITTQPGQLTLRLTSQ
ncbi:MAG: LmeA family phospholipid-binding protein [Ktedonobacterales bacterium]